MSPLVIKNRIGNEQTAWLHSTDVPCATNVQLKTSLALRMVLGMFGYHFIYFIMLEYHLQTYLTSVRTCIIIYTFLIMWNKYILEISTNIRAMQNCTDIHIYPWVARFKGRGPKDVFNSSWTSTIVILIAI